MLSSAYSPGTGKPGPLIGSPESHDSGEAGETGLRRFSLASALDTSGHTCNMGT